MTQEYLREQLKGCLWLGERLPRLVNTKHPRRAPRPAVKSPDTSRPPLARPPLDNAAPSVRNHGHQVPEQLWYLWYSCFYSWPMCAKDLDSVLTVACCFFHCPSLIKCPTHVFHAICNICVYVKNFDSLSLTCIQYIHIIIIRLRGLNSWGHFLTLFISLKRRAPFKDSTLFIFKAYCVTDW